MRSLSSLSLVTGTACNFSCPYCLQERDEKRLRLADIARFLDCLKPFLAGEVWLGFHGGEPLLQWPLIERAVRHAARSGGRFRFALTSNGSLLRREHIRFFRRHGFELGISYDGLAQESRDSGRVAAVERALEMLLRLYPGGYAVSSVFTPRTVALLAASMERLMRWGHRRLRFALDAGASWRRDDLAVFAAQLRQLAAALRRLPRRGAEWPVENFRPGAGSGAFACAAGRGRLSLLPDRSVWGCERMAALAARHPGRRDFARFRFGGLAGFAAAPEKALAAAARVAPLRQDFFLPPGGAMCGLCPELERCAVCPATAAWTSGALGLVPGWTCRSQKLVRRAAASLRGGG